MRRHSYWLWLVLFSGTLSPAWAQTDPQQRRIEEQKRTQLEQVEEFYQTHHQRWLIEFGGWQNYRYTDFHDDDNNAAVKDFLEDSFDIDVRLWLKATLKPPADATYDNEHVFYLRLKDAYSALYGSSDFNNYDHDGPHVDNAYLVLDFDPLWIEAGRKYFSVGRGIAYSNVNDGVKLNFKIPGWNIGVFATRSLPHEDNIDTSVPGFDKTSERYFYGAGVGYAGFRGHTLYGYTLLERDFSDERPGDFAQQYTYDAEYYGLGATGKFIAGAKYWTEFIRQTGEGFLSGSNTPADVDAWAVDVGVERSVEGWLSPIIDIEYAFGSGDNSRSSVTDTVGGNTAGDDKNFLYFGYIPTGLALSPRLSNLHMLRSGIEIQPINRLSLRLNYFRFWKDKKTGAIFDADATVSSLDVGQEIDMEINWRIFSDLDLTVEYGHFIPGGAYPDTSNNNEDYFAVSVTHTF